MFCSLNTRAYLGVLESHVAESLRRWGRLIAVPVPARILSQLLPRHLFYCAVCGTFKAAAMLCEVYTHTPTSL